MESKLKTLLALTTHPVAIYKADAPPEGAKELPEASRACVAAALASSALHGICYALEASTVGCYGGRCGLGFQDPDPAVLGPFLAQGTPKFPGIRQRETAELGETYAKGLPPVEIPAHLVFQPLDQVPEGVVPAAVVFLVNADQLSGLVTLANYDDPDPNCVRVRYGAGCAQAVRYALCASEGGEDTCYIGLTDPSARRHVPKDLLSFSLPFSRFLALEGKAEGSFLALPSWQTLVKRNQDSQ